MVQNRVPKPCSALSLESSQVLLFTNHSPLANFFSDKKVGRWTPKFDQEKRGNHSQTSIYISQETFKWHESDYAINTLTLIKLHECFLASQISVPS